MHLHRARRRKLDSRVRLPRWAMYVLKYVLVGGLCAWEVTAIYTPGERLPTISKICGEHKWLAPLILGGLGVHLYWQELGGEHTQ